MPQIYDMGPRALLPLRRKRIFALKMRRLRPGTIGQHATARPPKPYNLTHLKKLITSRSLMFGFLMNTVNARPFLARVQLKDLEVLA